MHHEFKDTSFLQQQIAKFDSIPLTQVQAANWYQTNYLPMANQLFQRAFAIVQQKCRFSGQMELYFQKRLNKALSIIQTLSLKHDKAKISQQICTEIKGILISDDDPLQFMTNIKHNMGPGNTQKFGLTITRTHSNQSRKKKRKRLQWHQYNASNDSVHPTKCGHCSSSGQCKKDWHNEYWQKANNRH